VILPVHRKSALDEEASTQGDSKVSSGRMQAGKLFAKYLIQSLINERSKMEIFDILKKDHRKVLEILEKLEGMSDRAGKTRQKQFTMLKQELLPHMAGEENYFYPYILDRTTDKEQRQAVLEGIEEHRAARTVLEDSEKAGVSDERWQPDIKVLKELIAHHIDEEEDTIFDAAREVIEDPEEVGKEFMAAKKHEKVMA
jgi:iron-sulfur cluster repair protein YtfE (RIC family)